MNMNRGREKIEFVARAAAFPYFFCFFFFEIFLSIVSSLIHLVWNQGVQSTWRRDRTARVQPASYYSPFASARFWPVNNSHRRDCNVSYSLPTGNLNFASGNAECNKIHVPHGSMEREVIAHWVMMWAGLLLSGPATFSSILYQVRKSFLLSPRAQGAWPGSLIWRNFRAFVQ